MPESFGQDQVLGLGSANVNMLSLRESKPSLTLWSWLKWCRGSVAWISHTGMRRPQ